MGKAQSIYRHDEEPFILVGDIAIKDGDVRRLWSYDSVSGGRYVYLTDESVPEDSGSYVVAATGEANGSTKPLTDITFNRKGPPVPLMFELTFHKDNSPYSVIASEDLVTASLGTSGTTFEVIELFQPNRPYVVLRSKKKTGSEDLYLSSDGAGKLKLKPWNKPAPPPPKTSSGVDPALLFRLLARIEQPEEN